VYELASDRDGLRKTPISVGRLFLSDCLLLLFGDCILDRAVGSASQLAACLSEVDEAKILISLWQISTLNYELACLTIVSEGSDFADRLDVLIVAIELAADGHRAVDADFDLRRLVVRAKVLVGNRLIDDVLGSLVGSVLVVADEIARECSVLTTPDLKLTHRGSLAVEADPEATAVSPVIELGVLPHLNLVTQPKARHLKPLFDAVNV